MKWLGIPKDPFGSIMITNIGSLGIDMAQAPLCPYTRVPILLTTGESPRSLGLLMEKWLFGKILPIGVTFDHRLIDGVHASEKWWQKYDFKKMFEHPEEFLLND